MITRQIKTMSWEKPYVSPEIKELEIKSEGLLCVSGFDLYNFTETFERETWEEL